jgi:hypothetical protein
MLFQLDREKVRERALKDETKGLCNACNYILYAFLLIIFGKDGRRG